MAICVSLVASSGNARLSMILRLLPTCTIRIVDADDDYVTIHGSTLVVVKSSQAYRVRRRLRDRHNQFSCLTRRDFLFTGELLPSNLSFRTAIEKDVIPVDGLDRFVARILNRYFVNKNVARWWIFMFRGDVCSVGLCFSSYLIDLG